MSESSLDRIASALEKMADAEQRIARCWEESVARDGRQESLANEDRGYNRERLSRIDAREDRLAELCQKEKEAGTAYLVDARARTNLDTVRIREEIERKRKMDKMFDDEPGKDGGS